MRCIGKGAESAVMFCGIMNLPPPPTKFTKFNNNLLQAARETCEESMAEAVHEAVEENEGGRDIAVAVDGSWQKRGFSSKNGVVTVTSVDTGKVIDVEILSKHCICPNKTKHLQNCKRNFVGYSGKMENGMDMYDFMDDSRSKQPCGIPVFSEEKKYFLELFQTNYRITGKNEKAV
ncbi:uncharacterized protein NPIL_427231 [Nephila pilipes]|uniref:Mutator-like transposase domain-containing protein n=1 Tax=Nephila pilipes TaxID=299642 RepID=A0A8X6PMD5_NEPPI|nr:uncharacterized protein NPIL_216421 [Nephila pilipes]GFT71596.1 uncharacterized protein NPIL_427231 [Nephila pilipes]